MDNQPTVPKKLTLRQPSTEPISLELARFVVLGGPDAGIHTLTE